ncbi:MAG: aminotransferase class I/II-fold pyridoxal phosphate-dependent enzyme [Nannocystaceae bacterium]
MTSPTDQRARGALHRLEARHLLRRAPAITHRRGMHYHLDGEPVVGFCSNDYLGYASATSASAPPPMDGGLSGAGASRLICGDLEPHRALERRLANIAGSEDAVLFPSGFQLNVGVLPALLHANDEVFSDRLIHASMIDGLRLAAPTTNILPHLQPPDATSRHGERDDDTEPPPLRWWICESLYSMDATRHDGGDLSAWTAAGHALYLDGAHDFGLAEGGAGWTHAQDIDAAVYVGTLGKAYGAAGAFVAASAHICQWLRNTARSFVFSTGISPLVAQQLLARLDEVTGEDGDTRRTTLAAHIARMSELLELPLDAPIVPLAVGDPSTALSLSQRLRAEGWHVQAIRPPTVPTGTSRLRLTLSAVHTPAQIEQVAVAIKRVFRDAAQPLRLAQP